MVINLTGQNDSYSLYIEKWNKKIKYFVNFQVLKKIKMDKN